MTWLKEAASPLAPFPGCAADCNLKKILSVLYKNENSWSLKKGFHILFQVIITSKVPVPTTILKAYISLSRQVRKDMSIKRWIISSHLCTAVACQQFRKESRKFHARIMFERYYSFVHYCLLSC